MSSTNGCSVDVAVAVAVLDLGWMAVVDEPILDFQRILFTG